ncbi:MAG: DUF115 domain-containing protein [Treponema sp.]|jgi:hypothetical protein|nr:DUF115 domain-containing protein [Treponema sp.]
MNPALHSRYNPIGEAEKYLHALSLSPDIRFFILIEPGLGYMIPILHRRFPEAQIIALHVQALSPQQETAPAVPVVTWSPESGIPLQGFLEQAIPDTLARTIRIIEWRPALAVYGKAYLRILAETVDFIKRIDANLRTIHTFGQRWFKNYFKNLRIIHTVLVQGAASPTVPVIITGAGPSLETAVPLIKTLRQKSPHLILAVSSSVPALRARGILPDLIITTDGGSWACLHLYECLRGMDTQQPLGLGVSLSAALPSQCASLPLLLISDGSLWQRVILQGLGIPFISLTQRGTVSASALDLAWRISRGNLYLTGMDLAHQDIQTHARPYSFERLLEAGASRLNPVYSQTFTRSRAILEGGSHAIYAGWFRRYLRDYPERLFTLGTNNPVFKDRKPGTPSDTPGTAPILQARELPRQDNPVKAGVALLLHALADPHTGPRIRRELGSLLVPDEPDPGVETLREPILTLTERYCRSGHG